MNEDGFICAEGDRVYDVKYGADVGYEIDMSLWGIKVSIIEPVPTRTNITISRGTRLSDNEFYNN